MVSGFICSQVCVQSSRCAILGTLSWPRMSVCHLRVAALVCVVRCVFEFVRKECLLLCGVSDDRPLLLSPCNTC